MRLAARGGAPERARDRGGMCGGVFRNRMAAENEATKNIKIKIRRRLKRLENIIKNATINKKRAASTVGRWDGTREQWGLQGECDWIIMGAIKLGSGGEA